MRTSHRCSFTALRWSCALGTLRSEAGVETASNGSLHGPTAAKRWRSGVAERAGEGDERADPGQLVGLERLMCDVRGANRFVGSESLGPDGDVVE